MTRHPDHALDHRTGSARPSYLGAARAQTIAPAALAWVAHTRAPRGLHIFDRACNLINERGEVVSIVAPELGNGPFNIVVTDPYPAFVRGINAAVPIVIDRERLTVAGASIDLHDAQIWSPRPNWQALHQDRTEISSRLIEIQEWLLARAKPDSLLSAPLDALSLGTVPTHHLQSCILPLCAAVANADLESSRAISSQVAGVGAGLTPAGDDLILGAVYAAWTIHLADRARALAEGMADAACPRTNSISSAWLRAASRGEAGIVWHDVLHALVAADMSVLLGYMEKLLAVGHTSGADALAGFVGSLMFLARGV
ncbi:MAG: DUF2877 domain-containing protein [Anaerolineae bacterium]